MNRNNEGSAAAVREFVGVLRQRKWSIILILMVVVAAAMFVSLNQTPLYAAESRVLVRPTAPTNGLPVVPPDVATESQVAASVPVANLVIRKLQLDEGPASLLGRVTVEPIATTTGYTQVTSVLTFTAISTSPRTARDIANAFAEKYIGYRAKQSRKTLLNIQRSVSDQVQTVQDQLAEVSQDIKQALNDEDSALIVTLDAQRNSLLARLGLLEQRLHDVQPDRTAAYEGGQIIAPATIPRGAASPNHVRNGIVAVALGLVLGIGLALFRDRIDDRLASRAELEEALDVPVLATVPSFGRARKRKDRAARKPMLLSEPMGPASEAYRRLRTSVEYSARAAGITGLVVSSPSAGEGKTGTTANLGIALAQAGRSVVLVSADLRRPELENYFGLPPGPGLSDWLLGTEINLTPYLRESSVPELKIMTSGPIPDNPAELLTSPRLMDLIRELKNRFTFVIFDSPPILAVADPTIIAARLEGTILVVEAGNTRRHAALHAKDELQRLGASLVGTVLNKFDTSKTSEPYYQSYYFADDKAPTNGDGESSAGRSRGRGVNRGSHPPPRA